MSQLKKLLGIKKKSRSSEHVAGHDLDDGAGTGYSTVKEKDLPKLHKAAWNGDLAKVKQLLNKSGRKAEDLNQLDKQNRTALHLSCVRGHREVVAHLLINKARTNLCDNDGKPPLIKAVECKRMQCVELLLEHSADSNVVDLLGRGALHVAAVHGDVNVVVALLEHGARKDAQDKNGCTALHLATQNRHNDISTYLVQTEAQINCVNKEGHTPLILAAQQGYITLIRLFLDNHASTTVKDNQGYTAGDYALMRGHAACANILQDHEGGQSQTSSTRGVVSVGGRRPSVLSGSQQESVGRRSGTVGLMFGPAADEEDASAMTGEQSQIDSIHGSPLHSDTWASSEEDSFAQDATPKPKPNLATRLFGSGDQQSLPTGAAAAKQEKPTPTEVAVKNPKSWEAVDVGGTSEEDNGQQQWMTVSSPPLKSSPVVQQAQTATTNPGSSDFDSDDDDVDNSDIDAQVTAALTGKGPTTLTFNQKQPSNVHPDDNSGSDSEKMPNISVSSLKQNSRHADITPPAQRVRESSIHDVSGGGLGIEYGDQDELSVSIGDLSGDEEDVTELMDSFDQRRRESGSSHGLDFKSLRHPENSGSKSSVKTSGSEKSGMSKSPQIGNKVAGRDEVRLAPMEQSERRSPSPGQEGSDDNWDDDEDDDPGTADQEAGGALSALGGGALSAPLHTRYFQHNEEEDDDIEAMAAPATFSQLKTIDQEAKPKQQETLPAINTKASASKLQFGSMTGNGANESHEDTESEDDFGVDQLPGLTASSLADSKSLSKNVENLTAVGVSPTEEGNLEKTVSEVTSVTEESQGEWEDQQRRQLQIEEQKLQRRVSHEGGGLMSLDQPTTAVSHEDLKDAEREREWEREREVQERSEKEEAAELLRKELEESRQPEDHSWDESISVEESQADESPQLLKYSGSQNVNSLGIKQSSSHSSLSEGNEFADKQRLLEENQQQQLLQTQERVHQSSSPVVSKKLPNGQPVAMVSVLSDETEASQMYALLQEQERLRDSEREAAAAEEKRLFQFAKEARERKEEEKRKAREEEERCRLEMVEVKKRRRERQEREELEQEVVEQTESHHEEELKARLKERRQQQEREDEERRRKEREKQEDREKELLQLEDEKRIVEERKLKQRMEDESKLREVKQQREAEQRNCDAELKERLEKEEEERRQLLEQEEQMALEAKQRREDEEQRVKEMEERLKQRQEELKQMEMEARKRREEEDANWRREQEERREQEAKKREEAAKKRLEEQQLWAEEQARRRQEQLAKIEEEAKQRREEQEKVLREEQERRRQLEAKRIEEAKQQHDKEMQFWRDEQERRRNEAERRQREELLSTSSLRPSTADLQNISALRKPDGSSPQPPITLKSSSAEKEAVATTVEKWTDSRPPCDVSHSASFASSIPTGEGDQLLQDIDEVSHSVGGDSLASSPLGSDLQPLEPRSYSSRLGHLSASQLRSTSRQSLSAPSPAHDPVTAVRLNETLRETRRLLDKANASRLSSDVSLRATQSELADLRRKYDELARTKAGIDQSRLDLDVETRSLRYKYEQELSAKQSSEVLVGQMKEQLARSESRLGQEGQARHDSELARRNTEIELRGTQATVQQLERQISDLKLQLTRERDSNALKEEAYSEQLRLHQQLQYETKKTLEQKALVQNDLKSSTETCQELQEQLNTTRAALQTATQQVDIDRRKSKEQMVALKNEIESLREKVHEKEDVAVATDAELAETQHSLEAHRTNSQSKIALLDAALDRENAARQAAELELTSMKSRLESKLRELERSLNVNHEMEKAYQQEQESWKQERAALQHEITQSKESSQALNLQLNTVQTKLQSLERDLQSAHLQLAERGGQLAAHGKETEVRQQQVFLLEDRLRQEKELSSQLSTKLEAVTERMTSFQGEAQFLRQQLDGANNKLAERDRTAQETQDKFSLMLNSLRSDVDRSKSDNEVRNRELVQQVMQLKEELARTEAFSQSQERETKRLQQELAESQKRQASCEGSLDEVSKARSKLESEKSESERRIAHLHSQTTSLEAECLEAKHQVSALTDRLGDSDRAGKESLLRLENAVAEAALLAKSKEDLERCVGQMSEERHQLEASLHAEKEKTLALREELAKGDQIRARLESRVNDLKGDSNELEEQLKEAKSAQLLALEEAEEARGLWETEVKTRSKLGLKMLDLERNQTNIKSTVDTEKKKTRRALQMRRASDYKVDALHDRNSELQKEVGALRGQLKSSKKRIRDLEVGESRIPMLTAEFSRERTGFESSIRSLQQQLDQARQQAMEEGDKRRRVQSSYDKVKEDVCAWKGQADLAERRERENELMCSELQRANRSLEEELMRTKALIGTDFVNRGDMDAYRKEVEAKARAELNKKLEEVNAHLEEQSFARESMERMRSEGESRLRHDHEKSMTELKTEVSKLRGHLHDSQVQLETAASEAKRYKRLFEHEVQDKERVSGRLFQTKDELSKSKAKLHVERHRARRLLDSSLDQPSLAGRRVAVGRSSVVTPLTREKATSDDLLATVKAELDRSVKKHLEFAPRPENNGLSLSNGDLGSSMAASKERYLADLKRNYFV